MTANTTDAINVTCRSSAVSEIAVIAATMKPSMVSPSKRRSTAIVARAAVFRTPNRCRIR